jgi:hypothetical protein
MGGIWWHCLRYRGRLGREMGWDIHFRDPDALRNLNHAIEGKLSRISLIACQKKRLIWIYTTFFGRNDVVNFSCNFIDGCCFNLTLFLSSFAIYYLLVSSTVTTLRISACLLWTRDLLAYGLNLWLRCTCWFCSCDISWLRSRVLGWELGLDHSVRGESHNPLCSESLW